MKIYRVKEKKRNSRSRKLIMLCIALVISVGLSAWLIIEMYYNMGPGSLLDQETLIQMEHKELQEVLEDKENFYSTYDEETGTIDVGSITEVQKIHVKYDQMRRYSDDYIPLLSAVCVASYVFLVGSMAFFVKSCEGTTDYKDERAFIKTNDGALYYLTLYDPKKPPERTNFGDCKPRKITGLSQDDLDICRMSLQFGNIEKYLPKSSDTFAEHPLRKGVSLYAYRIDAVEDFVQKGGKIYFSFRAEQDYRMKFYGEAFSYMNDFEELSEELKKRIK